MKWSWTVARIAQINLNVHATFLILLAWIALAGYQQTRTIGGAALGVLLTLAIFASVVLHEFGHALTARRFGVRTQSITLLPIGGVAHLEHIPERPREELAIALAGPIVTAAIAAILFLALRLAHSPLVPTETSIIAPRSFVAQVMWVNVTLLAFNLLPAFPMDGGRVLRAALAMKMPFDRATEYAARAGKLFALLFALAGLFVMNNPFLVIIAAFVWLGAASEAGAAHMKTAVTSVSVADVMVADVKTLTTSQPMSAAVEELRGGFQHDFPVVKDDHQIAGVLTREHLLKALAAGATDAPVGAVMDQSFVCASPEESLGHAWERLQGCHCRTIPVVRGRELVGLITAEKISEFVMLETARRQGSEARD